MIRNFRTYNMAVEFYRSCSALKADRHLKEQLSRASSSIALNLAEGAGRSTGKDQARFFQIAFGSLRECQAILDLIADSENHPVCKAADVIAAHIYKLIKNVRGN